MPNETTTRCPGPNRVTSGTHLLDHADRLVADRVTGLTAPCRGYRCRSDPHDRREPHADDPVARVLDDRIGDVGDLDTFDAAIDDGPHGSGVAEEFGRDEGREVHEPRGTHMPNDVGQVAPQLELALDHRLDGFEIAEHHSRHREYGARIP